MDQWYEHDEELYNLEIESMSCAYPEVRFGFSKTGLCIGMFPYTHNMKNGLYY